MDDKMNIEDCFEILKIDLLSSIDDVKEALRNLEFIWAPERFSSRPLKIRKKAEQEMQRVNVAYETVLSFLSAQKERKKQADERARESAKEKAELKAEEKFRVEGKKAKSKITSKARAFYKKVGAPKVLFAASVFFVCALTIIVFATRDQTGTHHTEKSSIVAKEPEPSKSAAKIDIAKERPISKIAARYPVPEPPEVIADTDASGREGYEKKSSAGGESESAKFETAMYALIDDRFAEAAALFKAILDGNPSMLSEVSAPYSRALQFQASELSRTNPEKAKALLLRAVNLEPDNARGHFQLGLLYVRLKNHQKAVETYQKAAELDPQSPETFFNLGYVYAVTKDYNRAREMYSRVVELAPSFLDEALFNLAVVYKKLGDRDMYIENLKQAIKVNPKNELAKRYLKKFKR